MHQTQNSVFQPSDKFLSGNFFSGPNRGESVVDCVYNVMSNTLSVNSA